MNGQETKIIKIIFDNLQLSTCVLINLVNRLRIQDYHDYLNNFLIIQDYGQESKMI